MTTVIASAMHQATSAGGTPRNALGSFLAREAVWEDLIEELRRWQDEGARLFDANDAPAYEIVATALDFSKGQCDRGAAPPTSVAPSGGGRIMFEWRTPDVVELFEIQSCTTAEHTRLRNGRVELEESVDV
jgi:hypothetical protein